jgi:hypothetical protein
MNKLILFDLDHTVINSEHRINECLDSSGNLDLNTYRARACTRAQVYTDQLLPLADVMLNYIKHGHTVGILTARHMFKHDYDFLKKHGLKTALILSRNKLPKHFSAARAKALYISGDAVYKGAYIDLLKSQYPYHSLTLYDDHQGVLQQARTQGVHAIDAIKLNNRIETFRALMTG